MVFRLIELTDQNESLNLEFVQSKLAAALDLFISSHETHFSALKGSYLSDETWNLAKFINAQVGPVYLSL